MSVNYKRKHQWTRSTEREEIKVYTRNPTLIYTTSCREVKGEKLLRERDQERKIRSMKIGGAHEVKERLFREGIRQGELPFYP
jgi:hypothetical protein